MSCLSTISATATSPQTRTRHLRSVETVRLVSSAFGALFFFSFQLYIYALECSVIQSFIYSLSYSLLIQPVPHQPLRSLINLRIPPLIFPFHDQSPTRPSPHHPRGVLHSAMACVGSAVWDSTPTAPAGDVGGRW